jgi:hypothetical protein
LEDDEDEGGDDDAYDDEEYPVSIPSHLVYILYSYVVIVMSLVCTGAFFWLHYACVLSIFLFK